MDFSDRLIEGLRRVGNPVLVGIDPRMEDLPPGFLGQFPVGRAGVALAFTAFGKGVVDAIVGHSAIVKFQAAFYEAYGPEGMASLYETAKYALERGLLVIIDGKRNDIGSTAEAYARGYLGKVSCGESFEPIWGVDALTVNPYLGSDGINPFVKVAAREHRGIFILVRTSNASAIEIQDLAADGKPIYRHVAERVNAWAAPHRSQSGYSLVGAVVGATYPEQLAELRQAMPGVFFLVPGYGTQGGSAADVASAFDAEGLGAIINSSRGLTFAYQRPAYAKFAHEWQRAVEQATKDMADDLASETRSSLLRAKA